MTELNPTNAVAELSALYDCDDGLVRDIRIECGVARELRVVTIAVDCVSLRPEFANTGPANQAGPGTWVRAEFRLEGVSEFRLQLVNSTFEVLSSGVQLIWREEAVFLLLDAHPEDGPDLPDLTRSIGYVAGRACRLSVGPLPRKNDAPQE